MEVDEDLLVTAIKAADRGLGVSWNSTARGISVSTGQMVVRVSTDLSPSISWLRHFVEHLLGTISAPRAAGASEHVAVGCAISRVVDATAGGVGTEVADKVVSGAMCLLTSPVVSSSALTCCTIECSLPELTEMVSRILVAEAAVGEVVAAAVVVVDGEVVVEAMDVAGEVDSP